MKVIVTRMTSTEVYFDLEDFLDVFDKDVEDFVGSDREFVEYIADQYGIDYLSDYDWARTFVAEEGLSADIT